MAIIATPITPCAVQDAGCTGPTHTERRCFRCGRPACKACSVRTDFDRFGCQTLCHDCLLALGKPALVIRSLARVGYTPSPTEAFGMKARARKVKPQPSIAQVLTTQAKLAVAQQMKTANRHAKKRASFLAKLRPEEPRPLPQSPKEE